MENEIKKTKREKKKKQYWGKLWNIKLRKYYGNLIFQQFNCLTFNISMHNQIIKTLANFFSSNFSF